MRAAIALVLAMTGVATAETPRATPEAIDVDRDATPPGRVELGFDGGAPMETFAASVAVRLIDQPIRVVDQDGVATTPVRHRETLVVGGALALLEAAVLDVRMPMSHQVGDRSRAFGDARALDRYVRGDLKLGLRFHVGGPVHLRGELALPTGDEHDYAGEPSTAFSWTLIGRFHAGRAIVAVAGGIRLRGTEVLVGDRVVGNEVLGAAGVVVPVASQLAVTAELQAAAGDSTAHGTGPSPAHAATGFVWRATDQLTIGARAGIGLDDQIGAPRAFAMLELAVAGRPTPSRR